ncbi:MAG TPA: amidohydrolase family protein [Actinomycetes bacterium]|jgi:imidazolonepropionase-like amidohydrolase|nr:amidohydrolase family protein [Actinomycetes bacterium]
MPAPATSFALVGTTVLDGLGGPPLAGHTVVVRDGRVHAVGPSDEVAPGEGIRAVRAEDLTVLPGVVDAHVHLDFHDPAQVLRGGVTTVRDLGWPAARLQVLERAAAAPGALSPRLLRAGQIVTVPGGYPTRAAWAPPGTARPVAGPEEAAVAVADLAGAGATVIKVALDDRVGPTLDEATLAAVVAAARGRGLAVTAHVAGEREVEKVLAAGVAELAHWPFTSRPLPDSLVERLARTVSVVPTLHIEPTWARRQGLAGFVAAGGRIVYGTDLGNQGPPPGIDVAELRLMVEAGMTPGQVLLAATAGAAGHLGLADAGVLVPGARADLVAVRGDPLRDLRALTRIRLVSRDGHLAIGR